MITHLGELFRDGLSLFQIFKQLKIISYSSLADHLLFTSNLPPSQECYHFFSHFFRLLLPPQQISLSSKMLYKHSIDLICKGKCQIPLFLSLFKTNAFAIKIFARDT